MTKPSLVPKAPRLNKYLRRPAGFTIVELLIVIVVIGILAAITIVSYSGIQRSAHNAQTASAIEAYKKGLIAYAVLNGAYPSYNYVCLGQGYPGGTCWGGGWGESAGLSTALKTIMGGTLPLPGLGGNTIGAGFTQSSGSGRSVDGVLSAFIFYTIDSTGDPNPKCPVGPIISNVGDPNMLTTNPVGSTTDGGNNCWVPLPDATKL